MRRRGWDQKDLADQIPCSPASITNMFKPGSRQIRFKPRIEELFGWGPKTARDLELLEKIQRRLSRLASQDIENIAGIVDSLASKR